jgi:hypothetical protein
VLLGKEPSTFPFRDRQDERESLTGREPKVFTQKAEEKSEFFMTSNIFSAKRRRTCSSCPNPYQGYQNEGIFR